MVSPDIYMRTRLLSLLIFSLFVLGITSWETPNRMVRNEHFKPGEQYAYKVKLSFVPIGEANVRVEPQIMYVHQRPCYKVEIIGRTTGLSDFFKVRNTYQSWVDTTTLLSHRFFYQAREREYKRDQILVFDHHRQRVRAVEKDQTQEFEVPKNVQDLISGFYFLRTLDYDQWKPGQIITTPVFFDDELYQMKIRYAGRGSVKTKFGQLKVIKLHPILPPNKLFDGENGIRIWVSDDKNHVPVKVDVDFTVGGASMELKSYQGNRHPFHWY